MKKSKRVILGVGYPNFSGNGTFTTTVTLRPRVHKTLHWPEGDDKKLKTGIRWGTKIRLVAEIIK